MWFTSLLGLLTGLGGPIISLGSQIVDLQKQKNDSKTQIEKATIDQQVQEIHDRRAVLVAEAGNRLASTLNASVRLLFALAALPVVVKLLLWDKVIGSLYGCAGVYGQLADCKIFRTDPLDPNQWWLITAVVAFYFLASKLK